jgi:hypothetical protein
MVLTDKMLRYESSLDIVSRVILAMLETRPVDTTSTAIEICRLP